MKEMICDIPDCEGFGTPHKPLNYEKEEIMAYAAEKKVIELVAELKVTWDEIKYLKGEVTRLEIIIENFRVQVDVAADQEETPLVAFNRGFYG